MKGRGCAKPTIKATTSGPHQFSPQLNGGCVAPPPFPLAPLGFEYLALQQVFAFFRWRLYHQPN